MDILPFDTALMVIDLQRAIDHLTRGHRNNPLAEENVRALLDGWRKRHMPAYHIRHDSADPQSSYRPGQPGNEFKPETAPMSGEVIIPKMTGSAFVASSLEARLRGALIETLVVTGVITNNSVESTVRQAGDLGFDVFLVEDACFTFDKRDWSGQWRTAEEVHAMSLANLSGEYCTIVTTAEILDALPEL